MTPRAQRKVKPVRLWAVMCEGCVVAAHVQHRSAVDHADVATRHGTLDCHVVPGHWTPDKPRTRK